MLNDCRLSSPKGSTRMARRAIRSPVPSCRHPAGADLLVEVPDTSLPFDWLIARPREVSLDPLCPC